MVYFDANGPRRLPHEGYKYGYRGLKRLKNKRIRMISREEKGKTIQKEKKLEGVLRV
jgi:hypothetical protein